MKLAKTKIKPAVALPCVLHVMNLFCQVIIKSDIMKPWYTETKEVAVYFRRSQNWSNKIRVWAEEKNTISRIQLFSEIRWFSFYQMGMWARVLGFYIWLKRRNLPEGSVQNEMTIRILLRRVICDFLTYVSYGVSASRTHAHF